MKYIIDRTEGDFAVCEDERGCMVKIPLYLIKANVSEGAQLLLQDGEYRVVPAETGKIQKKFDSLFKKKRN